MRWYIVSMVFGLVVLLTLAVTDFTGGALMVMVNLILILLVGGVLALLSERVNENMPRRVALAVVLFDLIYFLNHLSGNA